LKVWDFFFYSSSFLSFFLSLASFSPLEAAASRRQAGSNNLPQLSLTLIGLDFSSLRSSLQQHAPSCRGRAGRPETAFSLPPLPRTRPPAPASQAGPSLPRLLPPPGPRQPPLSPGPRPKPGVAGCPGPAEGVRLPPAARGPSCGAAGSGGPTPSHP